MILKEYIYIFYYDTKFLNVCAVFYAKKKKELWPLRLRAILSHLH